jgi:uncharacterized protein (TIGR04255 family)
VPAVTQQLPSKLAKEPLIDALFEIRFQNVDFVANVLPGFLFHEYSGAVTPVRLPAAEIPKPLRDSDPNLQYAPTQRLDAERYFIAMGDRNLIVNCRLPYPGWADFKSKILDVVGRITKLGTNWGVERYSMKYINLIPARSLPEQFSKIRMSVQLGDIEAQANHLSLQIHHQEDKIIHILQVMVGAEGTLSSGARVTGAVIDVDSIRVVNDPRFDSFSANLAEGIETLRQANKAKFFSCLTKEAIVEMEPTYA